MSRWLVTGATGLLGVNALVGLKTDGQVVGAARSAPAGATVQFEAVDLSDPVSRRDLIARTGATKVLHTAAVSSIESAEADPILAHEVNVVAAADLARQACAAGASFVYISSDAVFDGRRGYYSEDDPTSPQSEYGRSKARGEEAVLAVNPNAIVARVNFYGWSATGQRSLAEFFYNRLRNGIPTPGFTDVVVSTLHVGYLVEAIQTLVAFRAKGVVHVASRECIDKYDFARQLADVFNLDSTLISPAVSSDHLRYARGSNISLDVRHAEALLGTQLAGQRDGLERLFAELERGLPRELRRMNTKGEEQ